MAQPPLVDLREYFNGTQSIIDVLQAIQGPTAVKKRQLHQLIEQLGTPQNRKLQRGDNLRMVAEAIYEGDFRMPQVNGVQQCARPRIAVPTGQPPAPMPFLSPRMQTFGQLLSEMIAKSTLPLPEAAVRSVLQMRGQSPIELSFRQVNPAVIESVKVVQALCGAVTSLKLEDLEGNGELALALIGNCPELHHLSLAGSFTEKNEIFAAIKWPKSLESLNLKATAILPAAMEKILIECPKLKKLNLKSCERMGFEEMLQLKFSPLFEELEYDPLALDEIEKDVYVEQLQALVKMQTEHPVVLTVVAETFLESPEGDKGLAVKLLLKAIEKSPRALRAKVVYAELLRTGTKELPSDCEKAQGILLAALGEDPQRPRSIAAQARIHYSRGETKEALDCAKIAIKMAPDDDFCLASYAMALLPNEHVACVMAERACALNPHNGYALLVLLKANRDKEKRLELAYALNPNDPFIVQRYTKSLIETEEALKHNRAKGILVEYQRLLPQMGFTYHYLAMIAIKAELYSEALTMLQQGYQKDPTNIDLLVEWAELLRLNRMNLPHNVPQAIEVFETALRLESSNEMALSGLGNILLDEDSLEHMNPARGQSLLEQAYEKNPNDSFTCTWLGNSLLRNDNACVYDPERGIELLEGVIDDDKDEVDARVLLADFYSRENAGAYYDAAAAEKLYLTAHKINPENGPVLLGLCRLYLSKNNLKRASEYLDALLKKEPEHVDGKILRAELLLKLDSVKSIEEVQTLLQTLLPKCQLPSQRYDYRKLLMLYPGLFKENRQEILRQLN